MVAPLFVDRRAVGTPSNLQLLLLLLLPSQPWFATLMETGTTDQRRVPLLCQKKKLSTSTAACTSISLSHGTTCMTESFDRLFFLIFDHECSYPVKRTTRHNRGAPSGFRSVAVRESEWRMLPDRGLRLPSVHCTPGRALHAWDTRSDRVTSSDEDVAIICSGVGNEHVLVCLPRE
jgi:hypothetical protein